MKNVISTRAWCATLACGFLLLAPVHPLQAAELPAATPSAENQEAMEDMPMLRLTPDKPQTIRLDADAVNVLIGNDTHLHVIPDTSRNLILMPRQPGTTYFTVLDANGDVIMQRHVVVAPPKHNYVRIRRACLHGENDCQPYSMYYCPDICHEMAIPNVATGGAELEPPEDVPYAPQSAEDVPPADSVPTFVPPGSTAGPAAGAMQGTPSDAPPPPPPGTETADPS